VLTPTLGHFQRAALEIGARGDNDTLPFDADVRFVQDEADKLALLAHSVSEQLQAKGVNAAKRAVEALSVFSERLLVPAGAAGFRVTTKIHPFWNIYLNGLAVALADKYETLRSDRVHSYRFAPAGTDLFDREWSWRRFRQASLEDCERAGMHAIVVQTDISSFYEHISHHRLENNLDDLAAAESTVPAQLDRFLSKLAGGRSFGLPVGGQMSRILAEIFLGSIDRQLSDAGLIWRRYVDDFTLIAANQADAYAALSILAHSASSYGLTLNRTKTIFLTSRHYVEYVSAQLDRGPDDASKLLEIDLHFDPYSDTATSDYQQLKNAIGTLDVRALLDAELRKAQPDNFLISRIGRILKFQPPELAIEICQTLLSPSNLHAFRASLSTILRGVAAVRATEDFAAIFPQIDKLLDLVPKESSHLLKAESSTLHYLRAIRFGRTDVRAQYLLDLYLHTTSISVKRACIDCWRLWKDRPSFTRDRNRWNAMSEEEKRMLWLAAGAFGDEGTKFRLQERSSAQSIWRVGLERQGQPDFASIYMEWAKDAD
jgi:hypothetical protein